MAVLKDTATGIGTPKRYKYLEITQDFDPGPNGYNVVNGTITNGQAIQDPDATTRIITDNYARVVAHEMLHCCNVKHHGDKDFGKVLLIQGKNITESMNVNHYQLHPDDLYFVAGSYMSSAQMVLWDYNSSLVEDY